LQISIYYLDCYEVLTVQYNTVGECFTASKCFQTCHCGVFAVGNFSDSFNNSL